jgi:hypothetical protein
MYVSSLHHDPVSMPARFHPHLSNAGPRTSDARGYRGAMHLAKLRIGVI